MEHDKSAEEALGEVRLRNLRRDRQQEVKEHRMIREHAASLQTPLDSLEQEVIYLNWSWGCCPRAGMRPGV